MRKLLLVGLFVLLMTGCAAHYPPVDKRNIQKAAWWFLPALFIGATIYTTETAKSQQKKAQKKQEEMQQTQIEAELELAGQQAELTERQMELQVGQRQIELLADLYLEQDRTEPKIYYLPTAEPTSPFERINRAISDYFRW